MKTHVEELVEKLRAQEPDRGFQRRSWTCRYKWTAWKDGYYHAMEDAAEILEDAILLDEAEKVR